MTYPQSHATHNIMVCKCCIHWSRIVLSLLCHHCNVFGNSSDINLDHCSIITRHSLLLPSRFNKCNDDAELCSRGALALPVPDRGGQRRLNRQILRKGQYMYCNVACTVIRPRYTVCLIFVFMSSMSKGNLLKDDVILTHMQVDLLKGWGLRHFVLKLNLRLIGTAFVSKSA